MSKTVTIIGGGISGTLIVLNCIKQATSPITINWFDNTNSFCKDYAYSTNNELHLLNVRASNMSIFVNEPNHFINWIEEKKLPYLPSDFVPRKIYGNYLSETFNQLKNENSLVEINQIAEEVTDIVNVEKKFNVISKINFVSDFVILALGNFLPSHPKSKEQDFVTNDNYFQNPFSLKIITQLKTATSICIIGSGLTMVDVVLTLHSNNYKGTIQVISPHGYLPNTHSLNVLATPLPFLFKEKRYTLLEVLKLTNKQLKLAKKENQSLYSVIDSIRPFTQYLWQNFSLHDKMQFIRHLRHKWGVARHRSPKQSMDIVNLLKNNHQFQVIKARIENIISTKHHFKIDFVNSGQASVYTDIIINCTGPESNFEKINQPLVKNLLKNKIISCDDLKYGLNASTEGQIEGNMFTIGSSLKGILWESIAVPEIRQQALNLTLKIIA